MKCSHVKIEVADCHYLNCRKLKRCTFKDTPQPIKGDFSQTGHRPGPTPARAPEKVKGKKK